MRGARFGRRAAGRGLRPTVFGLLAVLAAGAAPGALAQPARLALVIGNGSYAVSPNIPPLPGCPEAARRVGAALRGLGFAVTERVDASRGVADAAVGAFARALQDAPGAVGVAYVCGHVASLNGRPFLLPVSAELERETDLLTQGLLARGLLNALLRGGPRAGLLALDAYTPGGAAPAGLTELAEAAAPGGIGFAAAVAEGPSAPPPLAGALAAGLAGPQVALGELLAGLRARVALRAVGEPVGTAYLAGEPAPVVAATPDPPPSPPVVAAVPAVPPAPAAAAGPPPLPEEARMTVADRRRVQAALAAMGYYAGVVDGAFGANTRAAIRRYQNEIGAEMTGTLTPAQAGRLVAGR